MLRLTPKFETCAVLLTRQLAATSFMVATLILSPNFATGLPPTIEATLPFAVRVALQLQTVDAMCVTKADFREAVRQECGEAKNKAGQYDACERLLGNATTQRDNAIGALKAREEDIRVRDVLIVEMEAKNAALRTELESRWPWWVWFGAGVVATGGAVTVTAIAFR